MAYDSTNKKIYVDTSAAKGGITPWDIAQCIGDYRVTKFGRDIGLLCTSPNINKWAKRKPVSHATRGKLNDIDYGYRGSDGKCGIEMVTLGASEFTAPATALAKIQNASEPSFIVPSAPFRMLDFDGYMHTADVAGQFAWPASPIYRDSASEYTGLTLQIASFYTLSTTKNADYLSLIDLMWRFGNQSAWTDIQNNQSYGYLGVLFFYYEKVTGQNTLMVALRSHSLVTTASDQRQITLDFSKLNTDDSGLTAITAATTGYLVPVICNANTNSKWVGLNSGTKLPTFKCAVLPFTGYMYKAYNIVAGAKPVPDSQIFTCTAVYGGTIINNGANGNTINIDCTYSSGGFVGITLKLTTSATSSKTYYYKVWDLANNDTEAYKSGTITIASGGTTSLQLNFSDFYNSTSKVLSARVDIAESSTFETLVGSIFIS